MKIGQKVRWTSQAGGFFVEKSGMIVAILTAHERPIDYARAHLPGHRLMFDGNTPVRKNQKVYLVEVIVNDHKPALYKPSPSALRPANS